MMSLNAYNIPGGRCYYLFASNLIFLQITKLRPREVKSLIEGHTAAKEGSNLC